MSTGKKSVVPAPGRYRLLRDFAIERVRLRRPSNADDEAPVVEPSSGAAPLEETRRFRRSTSTIPASSTEGTDRSALRRASALLEDLAYAGPGLEGMFLERLRGLGRTGLDAVRHGFPGSLWFDRHAALGREPKGRFVSALASLLYQLGPAAFETIGALLDSPHDDIRYYAALLASDLDADALEPFMLERLFDDDADVARLALEFASRTPRRASEAVRFVERQPVTEEKANERRSRESVIATLLQALKVVGSLSNTR